VTVAHCWGELRGGEIGVAVDQDIPGTVHGSNTYDETFGASRTTVTLVDSGTNQDACENAIPALTFTEADAG